MKRWDMMLTNLHYVSTLLNPFFMNATDIQKNNVAKRALNRVVQKMSFLLWVMNEFS